MLSENRRRGNRRLMSVGKTNKVRFQETIQPTLQDKNSKSLWLADELITEQALLTYLMSNLTHLDPNIL